MQTWNFPKKTAASLAKKMREFRARTEETATSEVNPNAEYHRVEVVRQIDWSAFDKLIDELEFCHKNDNKA